MKTGFVAMVGLPNAGKSTLVNALVGEKVGIISKKPQTTRKRVLGIYNEPDAQLVFIDAPGSVKADSGLNHFLQRELESVIKDADVCLAILNLDAEKSTDLMAVVDLVKTSKKPWLAVLTKTDIDRKINQGLREDKLRSQLLNEGVPVLSGSALNGADKLKSKLLPMIKEIMPASQAPLFTEEIYTTQSTRDLVAEIVREKCFEYLHQEVPYGLAVKVVKYDESHSVPKIYVDIVVAKANFVSMVVGRGGAMIKRIGASSRIECERLLGQKIYLETKVKLKENWIKNPEIMKELGYVITD